MVLGKIVAFIVLFATVVAVATAVSALVSGVVNVGIAGVKRSHVLDKVNLKKAAGSAAGAIQHRRAFVEGRAEVPFEDVKEEGGHKC